MGNPLAGPRGRIPSGSKGHRGLDAVERLSLKTHRSDELHQQIDFWGKIIAAAAMTLAVASGWEIASYVPLPF